MLYKSPNLLRESLEKSEFSSLTDQAIGSLVPTVRMFTREALDNQIPVGASKLGGCPDVPAGFVWPTCNPLPETEDYLPKQMLGGPLWFVGQVRTEDLPEMEIYRPPNCILSFFAAVQRDGFPETGGAYDDWRVFSFPTSGLSRMVPSPLNSQMLEALRMDVELARLGRPCFKSALVQFERMSALPNRWPDEVLNSDRQMRERLWGLLKGSTDLWHPEILHLLFGYPQRTNTAYRIGSLGRMARPIEQKGSVLQRVEADKADDEEWVLLAQFDTEPDLGLHWEGWGQGYFVIRRKALLAGAFEEAVLINDHT